MAQTDPSYPGWKQGWGVVKGDWPHREFAGIYDAREDAQREAEQRGDGWTVRWGAYDADLKDFISGDTP
jgi:hypothetical protein